MERTSSGTRHAAVCVVDATNCTENATRAACLASCHGDITKTKIAPHGNHRFVEIS